MEQSFGIVALFVTLIVAALLVLHPSGIISSSHINDRSVQGHWDIEADSDMTIRILQSESSHFGDRQARVESVEGLHDLSDRTADVHRKQAKTGILL